MIRVLKAFGIEVGLTLTILFFVVLGMVVSDLLFGSGWWFVGAVLLFFIVRDTRKRLAKNESGTSE